ncbi:MAG: glycoside hydrolase family 31 protein [Anaerolineae bacterium]
MANPLLLLLRGVQTVGLRPTVDAVAHAVRTRWTEAKFADPHRPRRGLPLLRAFLRRSPAPPDPFPPPGPVVATPGPLRAARETDGGLVCIFDRAVLTLTPLASGSVRVAWRPAAPEDAPPVGTATSEAPQLRLEQLTCHVSPEDGRITFVGPDGDTIAEEAAPVAWTADGRLLLRWRTPPDAHFYGLGERAAPLDLRGGIYVNWNTDPRTYDPGDDPLYLCVPFLLTVHSGGRQAHGLLLENTARSRFDLGRTDPNTHTLEVEDEEVAYRFFYGPTVAQVLERFTEQTGRHPLFPLWALGYHQCRWSYYPEERVRRLARDFRETYRVPCDGIHLDIHYMDGYRVFTWDRERFPDPARMIADLHAQGFKVVLIVDPGVKADRKYRVFREGLEKGMFCRYPDGKVFIGPVWPGNSGFPDFTDPRVRAWWGDLHRELVEMGVDGFWDDMNEPAVFGEDGATIPAPVQHAGIGEAPGLSPSDGCDHRRAHNVYGLNMACATAEGLARLRPDRRPFVITRSGWTGVQRYAAHWTADNRSDWPSLRQTLPMVLNLGLSGIAFTGADIGGFEGFASGELFTRWLQMSVFFPFCRAHTYFASPDQEPWSWGEPYLTVNREFIRLRYRLLPYLYTALWQCTQTGLPMVRPLLLAFQDDPATLALDDEFLCGDALLVAPVLEEGATRRRVYLPRGEWWDFWTDARYEGPLWVEADAPLERIPVFVRAGSVLPTGPEMDYVGQQPGDPLILHLYPVRPDGSEGPVASLLYEDDGESTAYQRGMYRLHRFQVEGDAGAMSVVWDVEGAYDPGPRRMEMVVHGVDREVVVDGPSGLAVAHDPGMRLLRLTGVGPGQMRLRRGRAEGA